jgi:hypothetical protein
LRKLLSARPSLEIRQRVQTLLTAIPAEERFAIRSVRVLEQIATPETRKLLEDLAAGEARARLTEEARLALTRLRRQGTSR